MNRKIFFTAFLSIAALPVCAQSWRPNPKVQEDFEKKGRGGTYREEKVPQFTLPDPLLRPDETKVATAKEWENEARYGQTCAGLPDDTINFQHDPLACAIALGWKEGVETEDLWLNLEERDGWLNEWAVPTGEGAQARAQVVKRVNGDRFNEFWLERLLKV